MKFQISKPIRTEHGWVIVYEFPNGLIAIEGFRPTGNDTDFLSSRMIFSKNAIKKLIPVLQECVR